MHDTSSASHYPEGDMYPAEPIPFPKLSKRSQMPVAWYRQASYDRGLPRLLTTEGPIPFASAGERNEAWRGSRRPRRQIFGGFGYPSGDESSRKIPRQLNFKCR